MVKSLHSPSYVLFRQLLSKAREDAGLTQTEVAARLRRPQSFVAKYEGGERRLDVVEFIEVCAVLGVEPNSIITPLRKEKNN
ncbi:MULTISPECIES: helix-turn-helix domain-containing protein [Burkholderia]|uniref:helix-turn-helix domain-containing protein n=1 Tax=Burkholderia TaxID=32008 RepID=UPI001589ECAB|nr:MULTISPECIES: helix-turn-helix transcriptional regulator [Burkholderia]MDN7458580.1 helix-turn-helix transcriptional regulator [Burkholderia cenocepacia]